MEITVNKRGQITIPKKLREISGIKPSRKLSLEYKNNRLYLVPKNIKMRIFDDEMINKILKETDTDEKEFNAILKRWQKKKSS